MPAQRKAKFFETLQWILYKRTYLILKMHIFTVIRRDAIIVGRLHKGELVITEKPVSVTIVKMLVNVRVGKSGET